jgi:hypothetical protein
MPSMPKHCGIMDMLKLWLLGQFPIHSLSPLPHSVEGGQLIKVRPQSYMADTNHGGNAPEDVSTHSGCLVSTRMMHAATGNVGCWKM